MANKGGERWEKKNKKSNKGSNIKSRKTKVNELDPISSLFLAIKKNKLKLIGKFMIILWILTYDLFYLKLIRPFYLKESRKLAQDALNYRNKKCVIFMEYLGTILHLLLIVVVVGNIYSMIPLNHLIDKTGTYIVISSVQDKALISKWKTSYIGNWI